MKRNTKKVLISKLKYLPKSMGKRFGLGSIRQGGQRLYQVQELCDRGGIRSLSPWGTANDINYWFDGVFTAINRRII